MKTNNTKYYKYLILGVITFFVIFFISTPSVKAYNYCTKSVDYFDTDLDLENDPCMARETKDECTSGPYYHGLKGWTCIWSGPPNDGGYTSGTGAWVWVDGGVCTIENVEKHPDAFGSIDSTRLDLLRPCTGRSKNICSTVPYYSNNRGWFCDWKEGTGSWVWKTGQGTETTGVTNYVVTKSATNITDKSAKLVGEVNPNGETKVYFRYSALDRPPVFCNDIYGSKMKATNDTRVSGNTPLQVSLDAPNLSQNTTYYYCTVSSNDNGIWYGGVKEFMTDKTLDPNDDQTDVIKNASINTKSATVIDESSVYLNGSYNTIYPAETWFEYRKKGIEKPIIKGNPVGFLENLENKIFDFLKAKEAFAIITNNIPWSDKVGDQMRGAGTNGNLNYLLSGLSAATAYEYRAVIKLNSSAETLNGTTFSFTTKSVGVITPGGDGGGVVPIDPCANMDSDINCNGTGNPVPIESTLPDLTAGTSYPSNFVVNVPTPLSSLIKNQGKSATGKDFYSFFQISTLDPNQAVNNNIINTTTNQKSSMYRLNNFFKINEALALANTENITLVNLPPVLISNLPAMSSVALIENYTFPKIGMYYVRACADKKSIVDAGLIKESSENNNCGAWTKVNVSQDNSSWTGDNGGNGTGTGNGSGTGYGNGYGNGSGYGSGINGSGTGGGTSGGTSNGSSSGTTNPSNLKLGDTATAPFDATVHYHEGIETVFARQIVANTQLAKLYGYQDGADLQSFAWNLADLFARTFGYVNSSGNEIRVSIPDIAAYQLYMNNGILTVYEYYDSKIVNIQKMTDVLRNKYDYEYYFKK
ncbi:MAG: hypothetical protein WCI93_02380 [bacterium]